MAKAKTSRPGPPGQQRESSAGANQWRRARMGTGKPRHPLVADIESFLAETGMTPTYFGNGAMRDPAFVFEARGGRDLRGTTEHKLRVQMAFYRRRGQFLDPGSVTDRTPAR